MTPWSALRPDRLATWATPFSLNQTTAFSKSPMFSARAFLQSIIPAPVFSRSSLTAVAEISMFQKPPKLGTQGEKLLGLGLVIPHALGADTLHFFIGQFIGDDRHGFGVTHQGF